MTREPDIAARLRDIYATHPMVMEAAAEVERLTAVLRCISGMGDVDCDEAPTLARRALEPKP